MEKIERPKKLRKLDNGLPADGEVQSTLQTIAPTADLAASDTKQEGTVQPTSNYTVRNSNGSNNAEGTSPTSTPKLTVNATDLPTLPAQADGQGMSKSQLKKLRKLAEWEAGREDRKLIKKEKAAAKRERKKQAKEAAIAEGTYNPPTNPRKHARPILLPITFIIDCDFDEFMRDGERLSLGSQLTRSYSDNRKAPYHAHLTISSFGGKLKERFDTTLNKMHESWHGVRFLECDFVQAAEQAKSWMQPPRYEASAGAFQQYSEEFNSDPSKLKEQGEVVYLSSEADETLHELKPFSTYIIGGLVDRNREKGLCYKRATERGIKTARLPIGSYLEMQSRKVLATNHVNEIMLKWLELGDWGEAFMQVIPKRKGGRLKPTSASSDHDEESESGKAEESTLSEDTAPAAK